MEKSINDPNTLDNNNDDDDDKNNEIVDFKPNDSINLKHSSLSKNALRKLRKQQKWEETREIRKVAQKEKDKKKKLEKKEAIELGLIPPPAKKKKIEQIPSKMKVVIDLSFDNYMTDTEITSVTSQLTRCYSANRSSIHPVTLFFTSYGGLIPPPAKKKKIEQIPSKMKVVIDLSFDNYMTDTEITSVTSQLTRCYSANRSSIHPVTLFFTSYGGRVRERFNDKLKDHVNWKQVVFETRSYLECLNKDDLIYLTADSTNTLDVLDENKVYIIGGIVDKNRHKDICYEKAIKENIATAQLPIGNYIELATRKVLTINHVFEILVRWLENKDWKKAFLEVIPQRKFNSEGKKKRRKGKNSITITKNTTENINTEDIKDIVDDDGDAALPTIHDESESEQLKEQR
ncbi:hypothetical protein Glove_103g52 [Diversispora epigaea]|uniref:tRNA (guanine(9)-N1)-methyltransferase n=1 Tax=Diversispora epigaea TaxID=1348612 RepID=A0A397J437_9GLOM|nr:hypothetical protein Glove_103g52 [Diversispora epigaea]